ncbi:Ubiquitin-like superfamily protein [Rhynchospora pubera]|uniref:Ubiquitin-like superfamily protein n=1 Tax=Rhynchospora pubera TaxID=906938 RepID=A0AAV8HDL8_9POAL|nr:Ubiquitin-like superfamily protein [Rhynchospora pubera]
MAMYIRVKRAKTTYYIQCDPTEAVLSIKQKLHALIDELPTNQKLVLRATQAVLDDSSTLAEQGVENDAVVELSLRQENNEFDDPNVVLPGQSNDGGN